MIEIEGLAGEICRLRHGPILGAWTKATSNGLDVFMVGPNTVHQVGHRSLTLAVGSEFRAELLAAIAKTDGALILDFSPVEFIDSHCIGVLVLTARLIPKTARLILANLSPSVERSLCIAHVQRLLTVFPDTEAALRHLLEAEQMAEHA